LALPVASLDDCAHALDKRAARDGHDLTRQAETFFYAFGASWTNNGLTQTVLSTTWAASSGGANLQQV